MNVLIIGGGGREHAIATALKKSPKTDKLFCAPGNGGTAEIATNVPIKATDLDGIIDYVKTEKIDFVVVAPDDPLVLGLVDRLKEIGIPAFGPDKKAAIIEGSKVFSKDLMKKYNIPTAAFEVFTDKEDALSYIKKQNTFPAVIKAEGLALGKGVVLAQNLEEAEEALNDMMVKKIFGESGARVVIEEFLEGPEVSVLAFCDGKTIVPMTSAQDHKRALDGDKGPNTGGMGAFSPSPVYTGEIAKDCMEKIFLPTMHAMEKEGRTFKGCLYFGLMLTKSGMKVIEYNCRFGDPETQVVLPRLKTDLFEIMLAINDQRLSEINIEWSENPAVCVVLASGGYPGAYETGLKVENLEKAQSEPGIFVYHAGTKNESGRIFTNGGRVLGVTCVADTIDLAIEKAYKAASIIEFPKKHMRLDIGRKKY